MSYRFFPLPSTHAAIPLTWTVPGNQYWKPIGITVGLEVLDAPTSFTLICTVTNGDTDPIASSTVSFATNTNGTFPFSWFGDLAFPYAEQSSNPLTGILPSYVLLPGYSIIVTSGAISGTDQWASAVAWVDDLATGSQIGQIPQIPGPPGGGTGGGSGGTGTIPRKNPDGTDVDITRYTFIFHPVQ